MNKSEILTQHNNTEVWNKSNVCTSEAVRDMQLKVDGSYKDVSMELFPDTSANSEHIFNLAMQGMAAKIP